jgi:hypothetical protein
MSETQVEIFPYDARRYRIEDGEVVVIYGSGDMSREALNAWADLVVNTVREQPVDAKVYILLDLTNPRQGFTPYTRTVIELVYKSLPTDRDIYAAVLMRDSILIQIVTGLVNRLHRTRAGITQRLFNNRDAALNWLRQMRGK